LGGEDNLFSIDSHTFKPDLKTAFLLNAIRINGKLSEIDDSSRFFPKISEGIMTTGAESRYRLKQYRAKQRKPSTFPKGCRGSLGTSI